jgi:hypothetical protein
VTIRPVSNDTPFLSLVNQLNQQFARIFNPEGPTRLKSYLDVSSLPGNLDPTVRAIAWCDDVGSGVPTAVGWDGTNWRRLDTNATL